MTDESTPPPIDRLVVGVDGSANGHAAATFAAGLAAQLGAEVVVVHAAGLLEQANRGEVARRLEEEWCAPLTAAGVTTTTILRDGTPIDVLLGVVEEQDADLIVVGTRGHTTDPDLLLGSTSAHVVQHASRPVVVVPVSP